MKFTCSVSRLCGSCFIYLSQTALMRDVLMTVFLKRGNILIRDCSTALKEILSRQLTSCFSPTLITQIVIQTDVFLHQNLLRLGTQFFLSLYASGVRETAFDITQKHFVLSGCERKGRLINQVPLPSCSKEQRKAPEERAHHKPWLDPSWNSLSWLH